jgi:hypothetical protein
MVQPDLEKGPCATNLSKMLTIIWIPRVYRSCSSVENIIEFYIKVRKGVIVMSLAYRFSRFKEDTPASGDTGLPFHTLELSDISELRTHSLPNGAEEGLIRLSKRH